MLQAVNHKIAWVTGGGSGIGEAAAVALAKRGATVVVSGRRETELVRVQDAIARQGHAAHALPLDVTDADAVDAVAHKIHSDHGRVDILVHSAGMNIRKRAWHESVPVDFDALMRANVNGAYYCCRAVLPFMRDQGDGLIVAVSSWAGRRVSRVAGGAYTASKHALNALVETINMEECAHGIRATSVCPGEVATAILDERPNPPPEAEREKMLQPEDIGELVAFVAQLPPRVCINDVLVSPTWNRGYLGLPR